MVDQLLKLILVLSEVFFVPIFFQKTITDHALPPQFFLISHRSGVFHESSFSWYCSEIKASILVQFQAPCYATGLSKTFAIEFDNVIAEVEKNIYDTNSSLKAIIVLVHSSSLRHYLCPPCKTPV